MSYYLVFTVVHSLFLVTLSLTILTTLRNLTKHFSTNKTFLIGSESYYTVICWSILLLTVKVFVRLSWIWIINHCGDYPANYHTTLELTIVSYVVLHLIFISLITSFSFIFGALLGPQYLLYPSSSLTKFWHEHKIVITAAVFTLCAFIILLTQFLTLKDYGIWLFNWAFILPSTVEPNSYYSNNVYLLYCCMYRVQSIFIVLLYIYLVQFIAYWSCEVAYKAGFSTNVFTQKVVKATTEDLSTYNHTRSHSNYIVTLFTDGGKFSSQFRQLSYLQLPTSIMFVLSKRVHLLMLLFWLSSIFLEIFLV